MTLHELWITIGQLKVGCCLAWLLVLFVLTRVIRHVIVEFHVWEDRQYFAEKRKLK